MLQIMQIKGCNSEDTMTLCLDSNKKNKTPSYSGALIWNSIPVEIRNTNMIGAFVKKSLTWMKDLKF